MNRAFFSANDGLLSFVSIFQEIASYFATVKNYSRADYDWDTALQVIIIFPALDTNRRYAGGKSLVKVSLCKLKIAQ